MVENGERVPRIHDLEALLNLLVSRHPELQKVIHLARILSAMAVEVRYPGMTADEDDAEEAVKAGVAIREVVRGVLGC
jgi:HEPN domain-containing protein